MNKILFLTLFCFASAASAQAQLYRWVDEKGSVHYTDQPPPPSAKKVEEKKFTDNVVQSDKYPYSVQQAVKNFPVTLFTGDCGEICTSAKAYLLKRGIPFAERLPGKNQADLDILKKVMPENFIPVLQVGKNIHLKGFNEAEWASALDQAGYPKTNTLTPGQQVTKPNESNKATPPVKPAEKGATKP